MAIGFAILAISIDEGRWDNHGSEKPLKALFGGLMFIVLGAWYLIRGENAKSRGQKESAIQEECTKSKKLRIDFAEIENDESYQAECRKAEVEMRKKAAKMERDAHL